MIINSTLWIWEWLIGGKNPTEISSCYDYRRLYDISSSPGLMMSWARDGRESHFEPCSRVIVGLSRRG